MFGKKTWPHPPEVLLRTPGVTLHGETLDGTEGGRPVYMLSGQPHVYTGNRDVPWQRVELPSASKEDVPAIDPETGEQTILPNERKLWQHRETNRQGQPSSFLFYYDNSGEQVPVYQERNREWRHEDDNSLVEMAAKEEVGYAPFQWNGLLGFLQITGIAFFALGLLGLYTPILVQSGQAFGFGPNVMAALTSPARLLHPQHLASFTPCTQAYHNLLLWVAAGLQVLGLGIWIFRDPNLLARVIRWGVVILTIAILVQRLIMPGMVVGWLRDLLC